MTGSQFFHLLMWPLVLAAIAGGAVYYGGVRAADEPKLERRLERHPDYTADSLKTWIADNGAAARKYVSPILFPIDVIFLIFAGAALAVASFRFAGAHDLLASSAPLFLILPILYVLADGLEDILLARMLSAQDTITPSLVGFVQGVTKVKIWSFTAAIGQTLVVIGMAIKSMLGPATS